MNDMLGTPVDDWEDPAIPQPRTCETFEPVREPEQSPRRIAPWLVLTATALVLGAAAGWLGRGSADSPPGAAAVPMPADIAATAELVAHLYLGGTVGEDLARLYVAELPPPSGAWINHVVAISGEQINSTDWEVTVAVDSLEPVEGTYAPVAVSYYVATVSTAAGRPVVETPPMRIPPPNEVTGRTAPDPPSPNEQTALATKFVELYLTGDPAGNQYLAAPHTIDEFPAAPYSTAEARIIGIDDLGRLQIGVTATTSNGVTHALSYLITPELTKSGWKVASIGAGAR